MNPKIRSALIFLGFTVLWNAITISVGVWGVIALLSGLDRPISPQKEAMGHFLVNLHWVLGFPLTWLLEFFPKGTTYFGPLGSHFLFLLNSALWVGLLRTLVRRIRTWIAKMESRVDRE